MSQQDDKKGVVYQTNVVVPQAEDFYNLELKMPSKDLKKEQKTEDPSEKKTEKIRNDEIFQSKARIGDILVEKQLVSKDQIHVALKYQKDTNKRLGEALVDLGFITAGALSTALAEQSGVASFNFDTAIVDPRAVSMLTKEAALRYRVFPFALGVNSLQIAMADIFDVVAMDQVKRLLPENLEISPRICSETEILSAIDRYYGYELSIEGILKEIESLSQTDKEAVLEQVTDKSGNYEHPLVRLVNSILFDAVKVGASDIHFEPEGSFLRIRYRVDGIMSQIMTIHKEHWPAISHRLKIMSGMNIADKINPQDGRMNFNVDNRHIDFRVSSLPTVYGENIVMRILDKARMRVKLSELGFSESNYKIITRLLSKPEGIIIVTGPTGSGKTTTLYAMLHHINSLSINIMTLEDPVEYELPLVRQSQVREGTSINFAEGIRTILRQDPDVILVGEIRDSETASMALRASMTGHQVYTTLHTNDAIGALPRMIDLGIKPSLMAGNIIGIIAQRLVRKLCPSCRKMRPATKEECETLGFDIAKPPIIGEATGCEKCRFSGYSGRVAVAEVLPMNAEIDEIVVDGASLSKIRKMAAKYGFTPMIFDGIEKLKKGIITIDSLSKAVDLMSIANNKLI